MSCGDQPYVVASSSSPLLTWISHHKQKEKQKKKNGTMNREWRNLFLNHNNLKIHQPKMEIHKVSRTP
ncbi:uncharacterized protein DS421_15g505260 [Arachis hypogaea]|nr:uncharacterized protein DS421_15g505260 [Arachis hypogaea]